MKRKKKWAIKFRKKVIDDRITLFKKKTACEKIIENLKKLDVINEKPFQKIGLIIIGVYSLIKFFDFL